MAAKKTTISVFVLCIIVFSFSCQRFEEHTQESESSHSISAKINRLTFDSRESFLAALEAQDDTFTRTITRSTESGALDGSDNFQNLLTPVDQIPVIDTDPVLSVDCRMIENDDLSLYLAKGYDSLVPNIGVAKLLNVRAEIEIDNIIYKISPRGTYYYPQSELQVFEDNYERFESEDGTLVEENTYQLADNIYRISTFEIAEALDCEAENLPDDLPDDIDINDDMTNSEASTPYRAVTNLPVPWDRFPTFNADAKTILGKFWQSIFGRNHAYTYKLSKSHRMKGKFYYYNYKFYTEFGAMGEMQKKNWIGWSGKTAHELVVGWSNIIFAEGYKRIPDYPANPTPSIVGTQTQLIPGFNRSGQVLSIVGLSPTDAEQQRLSAMSPSQLTQWFKIRIPNSNVDITRLDAILCYSADKVVTILPGGFIRKGDREKSMRCF